MQSKGKKLMLSSDIAKTRLKWTPELHKRFVDAVNQLGGSEKATPKSIKRVMGIHGITLFHLKSHLQKYRLVKNQQSQTCNETQQEEKKEFKRNQLIEEAFQEKKNSHIALQVQTKIERKLYEQVEVQRHLKLRVEAQGKYLQIILQKARESLSRYNESGHRISQAKQEPSLPVSVVDNGYTSSLSALTEFKESGSILKIPNNKLSRTSNGSLESSLTSSKTAETDDWTAKSSMELSLMEMQSEQNKIEDCKRKIIRNTIISNAIENEKHFVKRLQTNKLVETLDLNRGCLNDNIDSDTNIVLELNCKGI